MTTYVFFIGGTGARVLRSLTMLMASGASINPGDKIVPIIIDYDLQNGDLEKAKDLLNRYSSLNKIGEYRDDDKGFFASPIELKPYSMVDIKGDAGKDTFKNYIDLETIKIMSPSTAVFIESLYDNSPKEDPKTELNLEMSVGFKGNPNIGSVVFNEYFQNMSYGFSDFKANFTEGDRVFIVGSIFGGTGSSGLPSLVKKFRQSGGHVGNTVALQNAPIGACVVLPYFDVKPSDLSAINSQTFNSKAKAALTYYDAEINKLMNELYYIGCNDKQSPYNNVEGGKEQSNNAHLLEVMSAISILEFAKRPVTAMMNVDNSGNLVPNCYEYTTTSGLVKVEDEDKIPGTAYLDLLSLPNDTKDSLYDKYVSNLVSFAYFTKYALDYTYQGEDSGKIFGQAYYKALEKYIKRDTDFGSKLVSFLESFVVWANELATNSLMKFEPFDFNMDLDHLVNVSNLKNPVKKVKDDIRLALNKGNESYKESVKPEAVFLRIAYLAGTAAIDKLTNLK